MRVLITGAGLVGAHAAAELVRAGHPVALFDLRPDPDYVRWLAGSDTEIRRGDARDVPGVLAALRAHRADAVVHTAGLLGAKANRNPHLAFLVNAGATAAVAEAARLAGVSRMVHISSLAVYDWPAATTLSIVDESFPVAPRTPYAASKLAGESAVRCYASNGWLEVTVLRLAGVYGPGRFHGGALIGDLVQQVVGRLIAGRPVTVPAVLSGHEYLHAGDAASAIRLALERGLSGIYNVGTGQLRTADGVASALRPTLATVRVEAAPTPPVDQPPLCVERIHRDLPDWDCRDLATGLAGLAKTLTDQPWLSRAATNAMEGRSR